MLFLKESVAGSMPIVRAISGNRRNAGQNKMPDKISPAFLLLF